MKHDDNTENQEQIAPVRINLPYVKATSEQLKESSMTITSIAHFWQLQHYVDFYHMQKILYPQSKETTLSINMTAKTVRLSILENQNEQPWLWLGKQENNGLWSQHNNKED